jgi:hypothetical protein
VSMMQDIYLGRRAGNAGNLAALEATNLTRPVAGDDDLSPDVSASRVVPAADATNQPLTRCFGGPRGTRTHNPRRDSKAVSRARIQACQAGNTCQDMAECGLLLGVCDSTVTAE